MKRQIAQIWERIGNAALACGRDPHSIRLVVVSKTIAVDLVEQAIDAGATILGENYIQEAKDKFDALVHRSVSWHFIGHLQSNKAKYAVRMFDLIHSVDSVKLAKALDKEARKNGKVQDILLQVNISGESTKSGVSETDAIALADQAGELSNIRVRGLMTMPPFFDEPEKARPTFHRLAQLKRRIEDRKHPGLRMEELSMGMTGDFEVAIKEGATLVRIGTAIFGARR